MGKESKWANGHNGLLLFTPWKSQNGAKIIMGCCCLPLDRVKLAVNSKKETNSRVKMGKESNWAKSQNGPRVKMGFCSLPPDRVKLAVNSKKKQTAGSKWAKGQDGLLLFTPWKSQNVLLLFTPWQSQTNWTARKKRRVGFNRLGQKESSWARPTLTQSQIGPRSQDGSEQHFSKSENCIPMHQICRVENEIPKGTCEANPVGENSSFIFTVGVRSAPL